MAEPPAPRKEGREHQTGEGRTEARRVMRSGREDVPGRTTRSTAPVDDPAGPMIDGVDEPEEIDRPEDLQR